jgi:ABC-type thiamine transport system ATPase subunit
MLPQTLPGGKKKQHKLARVYQKAKQNKPVMTYDLQAFSASNLTCESALTKVAVIITITVKPETLFHC